MSMLIIPATIAPSRTLEVPPMAFSQLVMAVLIIPMMGLIPHMTTPTMRMPPSG